MKSLLVIDMLNDFLTRDGALYCGNSSLKIIPFVREMIEKFRRQGELVIFVCDFHDRDDKEFQMFPAHCVAGSEGAQVIDELPVSESDIIVRKKTLSSFLNTGLDKVLEEHKITEVHVVGVCTSICIMDAVGELRNRHFPVYVYLKGVADFDQEAHEFALKRMKKVYGANLVD
ncbi:MAG: cysteine hydrolase family protein [Candidatus Aminicenantales bacterium]